MDTLNTASILPRPPSSRTQFVSRIGRNQLVAAMVAPYVAEGRTYAPNVLLLEYAQLTRKRYNCGITDGLPTTHEDYIDIADADVRLTIEARTGDYVQRTGLDGMFFDTPLDVAPGSNLELVAAQLHANIQTRFNADAQNAGQQRAGALVNFGDYASWANLNNVSDTRRKAQVGMAGVMPWQCIEVMLDMRRFTHALWQEIRLRLYVPLQRGRRMVVGLYDPEGTHAQLAALLACGYTHPNLYYLYKAHEDANEEQQWNPWYSVVR